MAKEIYLYSGIYDYTAERLISLMEENKSSKVKMRMNTPGGNPLSMWGIAAKMKEHGNVHVQIDGAANSAGFLLLAYAKKVTALNVSSGLLHRADMYASTEVEKTWLIDRNKDLRAQLELKINVKKLEQLKGVTMDQIFDPEKRIDVVLTAKEMHAIGLVDEITELTPIEMEAMDNMFHKIAAETPTPTPEKKSTTMTLAEFKAQHPSIFAEAFAEGKAAGIAAEADRVGAALVFNHLDPEGVKAIIASGKAMTATQQAEFALKAMSPDALKKLEAKKPELKTGEEDHHTKENTEVKNFAAAVKEGLDLSGKVQNKNIVAESRLRVMA